MKRDFAKLFRFLFQQGFELSIFLKLSSTLLSDRYTYDSFLKSHLSRKVLVTIGGDNKWKE